MKLLKEAINDVYFWLFMIAISPILLFVWIFGPYLEDPKDDDY